MIRHENPAPTPPDRVVLLGARGFIGAAVERELRARGIATLALGSDDVDLADPGAAEKLVGLLHARDALVMLAALTPDRGRDVATLMRNLSMMQSVCAALQKTGCTQLIYVSSDAVYDESLRRVSEQTAASPQDLYGVMHYARELMARSLDLPVLVLRPTLVYGVDDTHGSYGPNRFRNMARKDSRIRLFGGGEETRDHIHVDDVARLVHESLLRRSNGLLNVATGISHSFRAVADLVAAQLDPPAKVETSERANPVTHREYDVSSLQAAFPELRFISLEQGVAAVHRQELERGA